MNIKLTFIGLISACLLLGSCNQTTDTNTGAQKPSPSLKAAEGDKGVATGKIAYVNTDTLFSQLSFVKEKRKQLESQNQRAEGELETRARALEGEFMQAERNASMGRMTRTEMQETEQKLMMKRQQLAQYQQEQGRKIAESEKEMVVQLGKELKAYLKNYAEEHGLDYILGYSDAGGVLYANETNDITPQVLDALNKEYEAKKAK